MRFNDLRTVAIPLITIAIGIPLMLIIVTGIAIGLFLFLPIMNSESQVPEFTLAASKRPILSKDLTSLQLSASDLDKNIQEDLPQLKNLEELSVHGENSNYAREKLIPLIAKLPKLRKLHITGVRITNDTIALLANKCKKLEELDLSQNYFDLGPDGLEPLKELTHLKVLNLSNDKVWKSGIGSISRVKSLTTLTLGPEAQFDLADFASNHALPNLRAFSFWFPSGIKPTKFYSADAKYLKALNRLKVLSISGLPPSPELITAIGEMSNLESLQITGTKLQDKDLAGLSRLRTLNNLAIYLPNVNGTGISYFRKNAGLRSLTLGNMSVGDAGLKELRYFPELQYLNLSLISEPKWTDAGLMSLATLTNLKVLNLKGSYINDKALQHLRALTKLEELDLSDTRISDKGIETLAGLTNLRILNLNFIHKDDGSMHDRLTERGLDQLKTLRKLETLDLGSANLANAHLAFLDDLTNLRTLNLANSNVSDIACASFGNSPSLENLILSHTNVTGAALRSCEKLPNLLHLHLEGTEVSDKTIGSISSLSSLQTLDLQGTRITDAGLSSLATLKNLRHLTLQNTTVTREAAIKLQKSIPECSISAGSTRVYID